MNRLPNGQKRTTIRLSPDLIREVDKIARIRGCSRSAVVSAMLQDEVHAQLQRIRKAVS